MNTDIQGMRLRRRDVLAALAGGVGGAYAIGSGSARAEEAFPNRPIEIICPWSPGGGAATISDLVMRIVNQDKLAPQPVSITYKPGANGLIGAALVNEQKGNAHVFMPGGGALVAQVAWGEAKFNPVTDLTPIALSAVDSNLVVAPGNSRFNTLNEVFEELRKKPRSVTLAGAGGGPTSWDGLLTLAISAAAGVEFNQIPFGGGGEAQAAVLGSQVDLGTGGLGDARQYLNSGQVKALAIFDLERNPELPDVPTLRELGYDISIELSRGWFAPGGINQAETQWYADLFQKIDANPTFQSYVSEVGLRRTYLGPEGWADYFNKTVGTIQDIYKKLGMK